jgi:hypothetical protein
MVLVATPRHRPLVLPSTSENLATLICNGGRMAMADFHHPLEKSLHLL